MWACQGFSAGALSVEAGAVRRVGEAIVGGDVRCCSLDVRDGLAWEVKSQRGGRAERTLIGCETAGAKECPGKVVGPISTPLESRCT
jgi:hypothetical protein